MCGIAGVFNFNQNSPINKDKVSAMGKSIFHRGPDDEGIYFENSVALVSRRLSIIDLSPNGRMPMSTPDGRYTIVYNGEIYNFQDLRTDLEVKGITFRSGTDTEVLLYLYASEGPQMLDKLNGMFAFAIWDKKDNSLFVARDRLGVKPFYYYLDKQSFIFASEQKAIFAYGIPKEFDEKSWEELLCFRYTAGENTPYKKILRLLPGHYGFIRSGDFQMKRWWNLGEKKVEASERLSGNKMMDFSGLLDSAVSLRRISDVPIGVFLSGGLDSSSIAASLSADQKNPVKSFSMVFDEAEFDETPEIELLAKRYPIETNFYKYQNGSQDLLTLLEKTSWFNDEPLAHGNDHYLHWVAKQAKSKVSVLLSGEGADEILGGYVRYQPLRYPALLNLMRPWLSKLGVGLQGRYKKLVKFSGLESLDKYILYNAANILPQDLQRLGMETQPKFSYREQILEEAKQYSKEPVRQAMYLDQHTFLGSLLDRNDRMTMGASIECRTPFLDYRLVEMASALPTGSLMGFNRGKEILRNAMRNRLPREILQKKKWGFGVPWNSLMRSDKKIADIVRQLPDLEPLRTGPLSRVKLRECITNFFIGSNEDSLLLLQLMLIAVWHRTHFSNKASAE